jgi:hypothetical protein
LGIKFRWASVFILFVCVVPLHAHNLTPSELTVGTDFLFLGFGHLWAGWDHLAFLAALLLRGGTLAQLVQIVTGFTISHSITLALAATGRLVVVGSWIEPLIALTIVVVAFEALQPPKRAWMERDFRFEWALGFGLLHGMAFGGDLLQAGIPPSRMVPALLGFNVGLEGAQILLVLLALPVLLWLGEHSSRLRGQLVRLGSSALAILGSVWFLERVSGGVL